MKVVSGVVLLTCLLLIASCGREELSKDLIPEVEAKFAEDYIGKLRTRDFVYVKSQMSKELLKEIDDDLLIKMAEYFRDGELISTKIVGSQVHIFNDEWRGNFSFELELSSGWNIANAAMRKINGTYEITGLNVYQIETSLREMNEFSLTSKSPLHYFILALIFVVPIFIFITAFYCYRTPMESKKWLWMIFIFIGIGVIKINWTSGEYAIKLLYVQLLGAGAVSSSVNSPWVLSAAFPLGAVLFWLKLKGLIFTGSKNKLLCDSCGAETKVNWGDASKVICGDCRENITGK